VNHFDPDSTKRHFLAAVKSLYEASEYQDALKIANKALKKFPKDPGLTVMAGLIYQDMIDPKRAENNFREALSSDPTNKEALLNLGVLLESQGRKKEGFEFLFQYLEKVKWDDEQAIEILFEIASELGKQEIIVAELKDAWEKTLSPKIGLICARQLRLWSNYDDALPIMRILAKHTPTPEILNEYAIDLHHKNQFEEAIQMYELAIQKTMDPRVNSDDLMSRHVSHIGPDDDYDFDFDNENELGTNFQVSIYLSNLSKCLLDSGQKEKGLETAENALSKYFRFASSWFAKINALSSLNRYQEAANTANEALEVDSNYGFLDQIEKEEILLIQAESLRNYQNQIKEEYSEFKKKTDVGILDKAEKIFKFSPFHDAGMIVKNALNKDEMEPGYLKQSEKEGLLLLQEQLIRNDRLLYDVLAVLLDGIKSYPNNQKFYIEAAHIYQLLGKYDEAIKAFENGLKLISERSSDAISDENLLSIYLGEYYILLHKNGLGENAWNRYKQYSGEISKPLVIDFNLEILLFIEGHESELAVQIIEQIYKNQPENPESIQYMFRLRFEQGRLDDCISVLNKAVKSSISDGIRLGFLNNLGYIQILLGKYKEANKTFTKALSLDKGETRSKGWGIFLSGEHVPLGAAFYLDKKMISIDWIDTTKILLSYPVKFWYPERTIEVIKCNLVALALAKGDADAATALLAEILSTPYQNNDKDELTLRDLMILCIAWFRNEIITARFAWQNYLKHKEEYVSEDIFKKIHPEFHAWISGSS
jgi:tetratricopeptide (TPR) repeat protein